MSTLNRFYVLWRHRNHRRIIIIYLLLLFLPSVSRIPRGLEKKLEENCRSDHYSGQTQRNRVAARC